MTSGLVRTNCSASAGRSSGCPSAAQTSTFNVCPSTYPNRRKPSRNGWRTFVAFVFVPAGRGPTPPYLPRGLSLGDARRRDDAEHAAVEERPSPLHCGASYSLPGSSRKTASGQRLGSTLGLRVDIIRDQY